MTVKRQKSVFPKTSKEEKIMLTGNDQNRLLETTSSCRTEDQRLQNLVVQVGSERSQTAESNLRNEIVRFLFSLESVSFDSRVHEANFDTVVVEERSGESDSGNNQFELEQMESSQFRELP